MHYTDTHRYIVGHTDTFSFDTATLKKNVTEESVSSPVCLRQTNTSFLKETYKVDVFIHTQRDLLKYVIFKRDL